MYHLVLHRLGIDILFQFIQKQAKLYMPCNWVKDQYHNSKNIL